MALRLLKDIHIKQFQTLLVKVKFPPLAISAMRLASFIPPLLSQEMPH
jgi:hypothetical protein